MPGRIDNHGPPLAALASEGVGGVVRLDPVGAPLGDAPAGAGAGADGAEREGASDPGNGPAGHATYGIDEAGADWLDR